MSDPKDRKQCFVIAPIGEPDSETRKRSDQVLKHVIKPAADSCGYRAERGDEIERPGMITSQVIQRVVGDPLVVADLTEMNPNVFYELAIRHAIRRPLVQLIKKGEQIPFDVVGMRTIQVDHRDLDSADAAKRELIEHIKAVEADPSDIETPISVSLELQELRESEKPEDRSLADLLAELSTVRGSISRIESRIGTEEDGTLGELHAMVRSLRRQLDEAAHSYAPFLLSGSSPRGFHPMMLHDFVHMVSIEHGSASAILVAASLFRDQMPWVYEAGMEAYRARRDGGPSDAAEAMQRFKGLALSSVEGPWGREWFGRSEASYEAFQRLLSILDEVAAPPSAPRSTPSSRGRARTSKS